MIVGIMQPYLFPYLGYFQLISKCDVFVFFDDVNFIKKGFIHRNSLMLKNGAFQFAMPLSKVSQNKKINETLLSPDSTLWCEKLIQTIRHNYPDGAAVDLAAALLRQVVEAPNAAQAAQLSIESSCQWLGIESTFWRSSEINYDRSADAQGKILSILSELEASQYINPIGGQHLYESQAFKEQGIELTFNEYDKSKTLGKIEESDLNASILHLMLKYNRADLQSCF